MLWCRKRRLVAGRPYETLRLERCDLTACAAASLRKCKGDRWSAYIERRRAASEDGISKYSRPAVGLGKEYKTGFLCRSRRRGRV